MMKRILVVCGLVAAALTSPGQALAGSDTTGPNFTLQSSAHIVYPQYLMGSYGSAAALADDNPGWWVRAVQKWSASDPSGICDYQLYSDDGRSDPFLLYEGRNTSYAFNESAPDVTGYDYTAFAMRVEDCAGNWSSDDPWYWPSDRYVPQHVVANSVQAHDDNEVTYTGSWSRSTCSCFFGGSNVHATAAGASATFTYTGNVVAWVSETGPTRGSAKIYQDGVLKATINTYSPVNTKAQVLWANWFSTAGTHTIRIVVAGTAGHPRVDMDGFVVAPNPDAG